MSPDSANKMSIHLYVTPLNALVDEPITIRLSGLSSGQTATLWAHTRDSVDNKWASSASFVADSNGQIDVATQQPVAGSYHHVDPMGLFWSMMPVHQKSPIPFLTQGSTFIEIDLIVEIDGMAIAATRVKRRFIVEDVLSVAVREQALV